MVQSYSPSTREAEARESRVQGQPLLHIEFQTSLRYKEALPKNEKNKINF